MLNKSGLILCLLVSAGVVDAAIRRHPVSHGYQRRSHRDHKALIRRLPSAAPPALPPRSAEAESKRDECVYGSWACSGNDLQRCYDGSYHTMRSCGDKLVCSIDPSQTGCIWPFQVPGYVAVSDSHPSLAASASVVSVASVSASATSTAAAAVTTVPIANLASGSEDDDDLPDCEDGEEEDEDDDDEEYCDTEEDVTSVSAATSTSEALATPGLGGAGVLFGHGGSVGTVSAATTSSSSSWTNTWWTPSPTITATASSTNAWNTASTSTSLWGQSSHSSSSTRTRSSGAAVATSTSSTSSGSTVTTGGTSAPHWVIYSDMWLSAMPGASVLKGKYNRFILAFWMCGRGAVDNGQMWAGLSQSEQQSIVAQYNAAGISLMISAFGATDNPTTSGYDPTDMAQQLAAWVKSNNLNGVDIDYEDNGAFNRGDGSAESWLITFQTVLRNQLPAPYVISHAPQAPWFSTRYTGGGYTKIHAAVGSGIDWYNVQFYNQGATAYTTCDSLLHNSGDGTSVMEINSKAGVDLNKIVIGKPLDEGAAANGYMDTTTMNQCVTQARTSDWNAGVMFWEWNPSLALSVIAAINV